MAQAQAYPFHTNEHSLDANGSDGSFGLGYARHAKDNHADGAIVLPLSRQS